MKRLRMGVAGLGRIGWRFHCTQIGRRRDFSLAAVADPDPVRRAEAEAAYACRTFAAYEDMLDAVELDAVVVATPTHLHKAHALAAIRRGLHVFLEKPMALNAREAAAIVRAAKRAGRVLTVYQPNRALAWFQQARRLIEKGEIGDVYHVRSAHYRFARRDDWQSLRRYGGGMLNNYGAHGLDQVLSLTGGEIRSCFCSLRQVASLGDAEDVVKIVYETRSGMVGEVDINQASAFTPYEFEAYGTRGVLRKCGNALHVHRLPGRLRSKRLDRSLASAGRRYPSDDVRMVERKVEIKVRYSVDVYRDLARAIRTGAEPFIKPAETLAVMRMIDRCRASAGGIRRTRIADHTRQ